MFLLKLPDFASKLSLGSEFIKKFAWNLLTHQFECLVIIEHVCVVIELGGIFLDGHDIKTLDPHWLRNQIGTVSQEPALFSCSIAENIVYGAPDMAAVTPADIESAARKANAINFIKSFPDGFDTIVGERGLMLSGRWLWNLLDYLI